MADELEKLVELYDASPTVKEWRGENEPDEDLIYRSGVDGQCGRAMAVAKLLHMEEEPRIVSTHTSKSVNLPVVAFRHTIKPYELDTFAVFRDNFYNLCCQLISTHEMAIPFNDVYREVSLQYLEEKRAGALEYHKKTSGYKSPYRDEQAELRYHMQMETPGNWEWYEKYAGDKVLKEGDRYFIIHYGWFEGFPCGGNYHERKYYTGMANNFSFMARSYPHMAHVINLSFDAARANAYIKHRDK